MLESSDADLVRRDRSLPGLSTILDPSAFLDAIGSQLPIHDIQRCKLTYLRYKPTTNMLAAYRLTAPYRVVDVYAKAYRPTDTDKLHKAVRRSTVRGWLGPGRIVLNDRAIEVIVFPNDNKLKPLAALNTPESRKQLLAEFLTHFPDLDKVSLRVIRYKPERRFVAKLTGPQGERALLKLYADSEYHVAKHQTVLSTSSLVRIAHQLGCSERRCTRVFEWIPGKVVSDLLSNPAAAEEAVAASGAALAELHAQEPVYLPHHDQQWEAMAIDSVATAVAFILPNLSRRVQTLAQRLLAGVAASCSEVRPIHGDFYSNQVLFSNNRVGLVDLDNSRYGDPATDLGNFIAHLERDVQRGILAEKHIRTLRAALIQGYQAVGDNLSSRRVSLFTAVGLFQLMPRPFRDREPYWPHQTELILDTAERYVDAMSRNAVA